MSVNIKNKQLIIGQIKDLYPKYNGCGEHDGGEKYCWASFVACCDASPIFDPTEHPLDAVSLIIVSIT